LAEFPAPDLLLLISSPLKSFSKYNKTSDVKSISISTAASGFSVSFSKTSAAEQRVLVA
jgi:hypothetical protein